MVYSQEVLGLLLSFFFVSFYTLTLFFNETNSSWLIFESIETSQIRTSILFNLVFANNTIWTPDFSRKGPVK